MELELRAIDGQRRRFGAVSLAAILVSFVHMAATLLLFSQATWHEKAAAMAMTGLVDVATWVIAEYFDYAKRRQLKRSLWSKVLFGSTLIISMALNGGYLWANRPTDQRRMPEELSAIIAVAFAVFVPLLIAVASLIRGELTDDRLTLQQQAQHTTAQQDTAVRDALVLVAQHEKEVAYYQEQHAQLQAEHAQLQVAYTQHHATAVQEQEQYAHLQRSYQELRHAYAQLQAEHAHLAEAGPLDIVALAQRLKGKGMSGRDMADVLLIPESTLRSRMKALTNGHTNETVRIV